MIVAFCTGGVADLERIAGKPDNLSAIVKAEFSGTRRRIPNHGFRCLILDSIIRNIHFNCCTSGRTVVVKCIAIGHDKIFTVVFNFVNFVPDGDAAVSDLEFIAGRACGVLVVCFCRRGYERGSDRLGSYVTGSIHLCNCSIAGGVSYTIGNTCESR